MCSLLPATTRGTWDSTGILSTSLPDTFIPWTTQSILHKSKTKPNKKRFQKIVFLHHGLFPNPLRIFFHNLFFNRGQEDTLTHSLFLKFLFCEKIPFLSCCSQVFWPLQTKDEELQGWLTQSPVESPGPQTPFVFPFVMPCVFSSEAHSSLETCTITALGPAIHADSKTSAGENKRLSQPWTSDFSI